MPGRRRQPKSRPTRVAELPQGRWIDEDGRGESAVVYLGRFRLAVHHYHGLPPEKWFCTIRELDGFPRELQAETLDCAKTEALRYFRDTLGAARYDLDKVHTIGAT